MNDLMNDLMNGLMNDLLNDLMNDLISPKSEVISGQSEVRRARST